MLTTLRKAFQMVPGPRGRWWFLLVLAVFVSALEMVGALTVYTLLEMTINPDGAIELPMIGDVRRFAADVEHDTLLLGIVIGMGVFLAFRAFVKVGAKYAQYRVANNAGARLSNHLVEGYLNLPYAAHLQRNSSELIRNAHQAVQELVTGVFIPIIRVAAESLITVGLLIVLLTIAPTATLLAVGVVGGAGILLLLVVQPKLKRIGRTSHETSQRTLKSLQQALHGIRDIKVLGREGFFAREYGRDRLKLARARYLRATATALPPVVIELAIIGVILLLFGIAVATGSDSQALISILGLFGYAGLRLQPSLQQIVGGLNEIKHATAPLDDLYDDLRAVGWQSRGSEEPESLPFKEAIRFENVTLRYEGAAHAALTDVNLVIQPGEQIGICGPTGGGKTTLVDMMTGLLEPTSGLITVDGSDLRDHTRAWQRSLGVVPQMVFLIDDTLQRNIALGVPDRAIDREALDMAIDLAQLGEFIASLPEGLSTQVGERGIRVSGGQRQRIAIARALYRRPSVLVLDEGTSAVDGTTEANIMDAVDRLRGDHTIILIAHRLNTVKKSDKVIFVEDGRIAGVDTFDALERGNERFKLLASSS